MKFVGPSKKRPQFIDEVEISYKIQKSTVIQLPGWRVVYLINHIWTPVHPFFGKRQEQNQDTAFKWLKPLGTGGSCLHGINLQPKATTRVGAFDLDGTVIKSGFNVTFEWWRSSVPDKLRELHQTGYDRQILTRYPVSPANFQLFSTYNFQSSSQASSVENLEREDITYGRGSE